MSGKLDHPFDYPAEGMQPVAYQMLASAILWRAAVDLAMCLKAAVRARAGWQRVAYFWVAFDPLSFWESPWADTLASSVGGAAERLQAIIRALARSCGLLPVSAWLDLDRPVPSMSRREAVARMFLMRLSQKAPGLLRYGSWGAAPIAGSADPDGEGADSEAGGIARDAYVLASRLQRMARKEGLPDSTFSRVVDQATRWAVAVALGMDAPPAFQILIPRPPRVLHLWYVQEPMPFRFHTERRPVDPHTRSLRDSKT
ncbi:MAG: hypothetical protein RML46_11260 [Anaerolineae bacterium]|nr:hypothetical protein [Anaerolineae bacterium]